MNTLTKAIPLLYLGAGIVAVFVIWRYLNKSGKFLTETIGEPLADFIVSQRGVPAEISDESNNIVLPNGQKITWNQVIAAGSKLSSDNTFVWQNVRYRVTERGSNGAWQTRLA